MFENCIDKFVGGCVEVNYQSKKKSNSGHVRKRGPIQLRGGGDVLHELSGPATKNTFWGLPCGSKFEKSNE